MPIYKRKCLICEIEFQTCNSKKVVCPGNCRKIANKIYAQKFMAIKRAIYKLKAKEIKPNIVIS